MPQSRTQGVYRLDFFGPAVTVAFSGRQFGLDRREDFLRDLAIHPENLVLLKQVHSANLVLVSAEQREYSNCPADGMLTRTPGLALGILTADCVPIYFWDSQKKAVGIAHAGWRGVYQGIAGKMVQAFRQNFLSRPEDIRVAFGPAIRKCCYQVGSEFEDFFPEFFVKQPGPEGKGFMDLIAAIGRDLAAEGIAANSVHDSGLCTACLSDRFFSYRRERETSERILSVISLCGEVS